MNLIGGIWSLGYLGGHHLLQCQHLTGEAKTAAGDHVQSPACVCWLWLYAGKPLEYTLDNRTRLGYSE